MAESQPAQLKWYHWTALAGCSALMIVLGATEAMQGADPSSRFFTLDTWVVRVLGVALVVCALWLPLRHDRAFVASMWVLGLTLVENLTTYRFESYTLSDTLGTLFILAVMVVAPIFILAELRAVFRADAESSRA